MLPATDPARLARGERCRLRRSLRPLSGALGTQTPFRQTLLGGFGGTALVVGVRWSFRGKDAGSVHIGRYGRDRGRGLGRAARPGGSDAGSPNPPTDMEVGPAASVDPLGVGLREGCCGAVVAAR